MSSLNINFKEIETTSFLTKYFTKNVILSREIIIDNNLEKLLSKKKYNVVNLGCGLDSRHVRYLDKVNKWYDIDLDSTIDVKNNIYQENENYKQIKSDIFSKDWLNYVALENSIIICEGVLMYYPKQIVIEFINSLFYSFTKSFFIFEFIGKYGENYLHPMFKKINIDLPYKSSISNEKDLNSLNSKLLNKVNIIDNDSLNWLFLDKFLNIFSNLKSNLFSTIYIFENET